MKYNKQINTSYLVLVYFLFITNEIIAQAVIRERKA